MKIIEIHSKFLRFDWLTHFIVIVFLLVTLRSFWNAFEPLALQGY